jgi:hypothetical protein
MSDAVLFVLVFGGLFILRGVAATIVFLWILPDGVRCPQCDAETVRLSPSRVMRLLRGFRSSWCLVCGWRGVHRIAKDDPAPTPTGRASRSGAPTHPPAPLR